MLLSLAVLGKGSSNLDFVARHERGSRLQVVHKGLVLELTFEAPRIADPRIADTVPRLDADEGCLLAERTPEGDDGGAEGDSHFWIATSA